MFLTLSVARRHDFTHNPLFTCLYPQSSIHNTLTSTHVHCVETNKREFFQLPTHPWTPVASPCRGALQKAKPKRHRRKRRMLCPILSWVSTRMEKRSGRIFRPIHGKAEEWDGRGALTAAVFREASPPWRTSGGRKRVLRRWGTCPIKRECR